MLRRVQVTVSQRYVNREENPIECEYFFPIEEEAAVVDFRAEVEDRVLVSQVGQGPDLAGRTGSWSRR